MLCFANPVVTIWFISPLVRVQQSSKHGGGRHRPPVGTAKNAHSSEVGKEHLEGSHAQKPPPPPHSTNKNFIWVITLGIMQMSWGKVQLHDHSHLSENYFWILDHPRLKHTEELFRSKFYSVIDFLKIRVSLYLNTYNDKGSILVYFTNGNFKLSGKAHLYLQPNPCTVC